MLYPPTTEAGWDKEKLLINWGLNKVPSSRKMHFVFIVIINDYISLKLLVQFSVILFYEMY